MHAQTYVCTHEAAGCLLFLAACGFVVMEEDRSIGVVSGRTYWLYIRSGGVFLAIFVLLNFFGWRSLVLRQRAAVQSESERQLTSLSIHHRLTVAACFVLFLCICSVTGLAHGHRCLAAAMDKQGPCQAAGHGPGQHICCPWSRHSRIFPSW